MLWVFAGTDLLECDRLARESVPGCIDISKTRVGDLAETIKTIYSHHPGSSIYIGFLDPIYMMPHETACRKVFRGCTVAMVCSNPLLLPFSWKNGTEKLVIVGDTKTKNASSTQTIDNGSSPHLQDEDRHGRDAPRNAPRRRNHKDRKEGDHAPGRVQA